MNQKFIPLSVPNLKGNELKYVTEAIETEWVSTGGAFIDSFEKNLAEYVKSEKAVSCQNGTSGLHLALKLVGVTENDEVIVPTLTFIAAVNPVKYANAEPIFMDCDDTLNMDVKKIKEFCEYECDFIDNKLINKKTKKHIKALIVVHVFGNIANIEAIMELSEKFNFKVIEDSTEALGSYYTEGKYKGKFAGTIGHIGVYSFNGNKIMTTGGGGMIVSNNMEYLDRAKHLSTQAKSDTLYYTHDEIGYNYRMTNLQAGVGLAQLEKLEEFIKTKEENYKIYKEEIPKIKGLDILDFEENTRPNYWFYSLYIDDEYSLNRDEVIKYLHSKGVQTRPIWGLISDQKPYLSSQTYKIENAKKYLDRVVNIPCSSNLTKEEVKYVIKCLKEVN